MQPTEFGEQSIQEPSVHSVASQGQIFSRMDDRFLTRRRTCFQVYRRTVGLQGGDLGPTVSERSKSVFENPLRHGRRGQGNKMTFFAELTHVHCKHPRIATWLCCCIRVLDPFRPWLFFGRMVFAESWQENVAQRVRWDEWRNGQGVETKTEIPIPRKSPCSFLLGFEWLYKPLHLLR